VVDEVFEKEEGEEREDVEGPGEEKELKVSAARNWNEMHRL
jgi:hypothetical protein